MAFASAPQGHFTKKPATSSATGYPKGGAKAAPAKRPLPPTTHYLQEAPPRIEVDGKLVRDKEAPIKFVNNLFIREGKYNDLELVVSSKGEDVVLTAGTTYYLKRRKGAESSEE